MMYRYDTLPSTNETAKELARAGAPHGTIVVTGEQTAGKGQQGHSFFSPAGHGLYVSFILGPTQEGKCVHTLDRTLLETPPLATIWTALQVCEAIEAISDASPRVKWINDILLDGRKIGGVLAEAETRAGQEAPEWLVLGIGINISTPNGLFPPELQDSAGALFEGIDEATARTRTEELLQELIQRILGEASATPTSLRSVIARPDAQSH